VARYGDKTLGHQEIPNSNTRLAQGHHLYKTGDWKAFKKPKNGQEECESAIKLIYVALRVILLYMVAYFLV
jgi:hypothetical protein